MVTISWCHLSCRHLSSIPLPLLSFFLFLCGYSITVSAFLCHPPRRAHKCSSAALITVWQTTVEGWRQLLVPIPSSPNSTSYLSRQGHPAAREGECQAVSRGFLLPLLVSLQRFLAPTKTMAVVWFSTVWSDHLPIIITIWQCVIYGFLMSNVNIFRLTLIIT